MEVEALEQCVLLHAVARGMPVCNVSDMFLDLQGLVVEIANLVFHRLLSNAGLETELPPLVVTQSKLVVFTFVWHRLFVRLCCRRLLLYFGNNFGVLFGKVNIGMFIFST